MPLLILEEVGSGGYLLSPSLKRVQVDVGGGLREGHQDAFCSQDARGQRQQSASNTRLRKLDFTSSWQGLC